MQEEQKKIQSAVSIDGLAVEVHEWDFTCSRLHCFKGDIILFVSEITGCVQQG